MSFISCTGLPIFFSDLSHWCDGELSIFSTFRLAKVRAWNNRHGNLSTKVVPSLMPALGSKVKEIGLVSKSVETNALSAS